MGLKEVDLEGRREAVINSGIITLSETLSLKSIQSCETHWVPGNWEQCTSTCGKNGMRYRYL